MDRAPPQPQPTDPTRAIEAQARVNRIDQITPWGDLRFTGPERNTATLTLDPRLQGLFDQQLDLDASLMGAAGQAIPGIEGLINNPLSTEGLPELPKNFDAFRDDISRDFFERSSGLLNEQFGQDEERLRQRLANQGLQSGGQGFGTEMGLFNQRRGETFENLARDATLFGGQEASRALQGQGSLRNTIFNERGAVRGNQFNELASLLGLQQVQQPGLNSFFGPGQVNAVDPFINADQMRQRNFQSQLGLTGQNNQALASLLGNVAGFGIMRGL